ncbi:MAG: PIN domain-containing protein [Burkholderiales bacterium]|nr:PIN domain-containing protein [Burkholderiales bacterium]
MIAVDTNILVYAHRADSAFHDGARAALESLAVGTRPWALPWPCAHEFFAVVTHPRIYRTPTPAAMAFDQLRALQTVANLVFIAEADGYLAQLEPLALAAKAQGGAIHDARIAAICLSHGVAELWSADRDFSRFASLKVRNPLMA